MANYHCAIRNISRGAEGNGKSSVAAAAYRAGETLHDERTGKTHYYANRQDDIIFSGILAPANAPDWAQQRATLWNNVEVAERYKNGRTAKEIIVTLPYELSSQQQQGTVTQFVKNNIVNPYGLAVDVAIHRYGRKTAPDDESRINQWNAKGLPFLTADEASKCDSAHVKIMQGQQGEITGYKLYQPHAHILMTMREFDAQTKTGFAKKKNRDIDNRNQLVQWREAWQNNLNQTFNEHDLGLKVSCKPKHWQAANDDETEEDPKEWLEDQVEKYSYELEHLKPEEAPPENDNQEQAINDNEPEYLEETDLTTPPPEFFAGLDLEDQRAKAVTPNAIVEKRIAELRQDAKAEAKRKVAEILAQSQADNAAIIHNFGKSLKKLSPIADKTDSLTEMFLDWGRRFDKRQQNYSKQRDNSVFSGTVPHESGQDLER